MSAFRALLIALLCGTLSYLVACDTKVTGPGTTSAQHEKSPDAQLARFEAELARAYPADAPKPTKTREFELRAAPTTVKQIDGRDLDVWAYNGQVPGPVLRVKLGEEVLVRFKNDLPQATTIHWHGVRVPNAMDGVPGVTQDAIEPGESFEYRFVPKDAGTFWFHPHHQTPEQVGRGLYGVLVVEDAEPLGYTRDEMWVLDDWKLGRDGQIDPRFVTRHDLSHDGRWGRDITVNGESHKVMEVRPGERLRLRLLDASNGRVYQLRFDGLDAKVIATDGMYTGKPVTLLGQKTAPGNRLDVDITIPKDAAGKSFALMNDFGRQPTVLATLKVAGEPVETPTFEPPFNPNLPKWEGALERDIDQTYVLDARRGGPHGIEWTINGEVWGTHEPTVLKEGRWKRIRFQNDSFRLHPMHIHGQFFKVLARNGVPVDEPFLRDTVLLERKEVIDVGMVPLDWGYWMMHCHILEHAEAGMMTEIHVEK
ncbi:multicopper oxidase family protein [Bradymonas sediminis]|uniref:Multicopper oxidase family protein n=1 Tax=Bradymonas sediminis TaxID=1548548 RepID=A0A2Z4FJ34_9DELT|nr:multicopper oxidase family protein [Bradymonas sediminis]AWV88676.1 multicopper oxidase family protein [Bradymonas sediminis]TDP63637.1 FtsP/CotA-like multicopper oxidase with cupredoxin domain [Bradymonas sediminis]